MARIYCHKCGTPLPKRAKICIQCETVVVAQSLTEVRHRCLMEWLAISCVALSCLVFVVCLGVTNLFRDGNWRFGAISFFAIVVSIYWVKKYETTD